MTFDILNDVFNEEIESEESKENSNIDKIEENKKDKSDKDIQFIDQDLDVAADRSSIQNLDIISVEPSAKEEDTKEKLLQRKYFVWTRFYSSKKKRSSLLLKS